MSTTVKSDSFQRLVMLANEAALDSSRWRWFLKELSAAAGGAWVQIFSHDTRTGQPLGFFEHGYDPDYLASYQSYYGSMNIWAKGFTRMPMGKAFIGRQVVSDEELEKTEFYNDWVRPQGDLVGGVGAIVDANAGRITAFGANLRRKDRDDIEAPLRDLLQRLLPHLKVALQTAGMLGNLKIENRVLWTGIDPGIAAIFILDSRGRLRYANARGDALTDKGDIVQIGPGQRLRLTDKLANAELARALNDRITHGVSVSLPFFAQGPVHEQFVCRAVPLSESEGPQPWLGQNSEAERAFTLLILSPVAQRIPQETGGTSVR